MKVPLHDILAELGIQDMTSQAEISKIPKEKFALAAAKIKDRVASHKKASKKQTP